MEKLNLPLIQGPTPPPPVLSMEEYLGFIQMYLKYFHQPESDADWRKKQGIKAPFTLK